MIDDLLPVFADDADRPVAERLERLYPGQEWYFRYEDRLQSEGYVDEWGDYHSTGTRSIVQLRWLPVLKHTPKGVWVSLGGVNETDRRHMRFVCKNWNKQYAHADRDEAWAALVRRKQSQKRFLERDLRHCNRVMAMSRKDVANDR